MPYQPIAGDLQLLIDATTLIGRLKEASIPTLARQLHIPAAQAGFAVARLQERGIASTGPRIHLLRTDTETVAALLRKEHSAEPLAPVA